MYVIEDKNNNDIKDEILNRVQVRAVLQKAPGFSFSNTNGVIFPEPMMVTYSDWYDGMSEAFTQYGLWDQYQE